MKDAFKSLKEAIEQYSEHLYQLTQIIFVNPEDGIHLELEKIPDNVFLICNHNVKKGESYLIKDSQLKRQLFDFCTEHPDRVFRGKKVD